MAATATATATATPHVGLIVTGADTLFDFQVFVKTLSIWHPDAQLFVFTDFVTEPYIKAIKTTLTIHTRSALTKYAGKDRKVMELLPGTTYKTMWTDFMYEKANVLAWMFSTNPALKTQGAWFLDADITFLAPLPVIPSEAVIALSPHHIRPFDEARFGKYNGGFLWIKDDGLLDVWRTAGYTARFYEQSALETIAAVATEKSVGNLYEFPIQVNFGWWRMYQGLEAPDKIQAKFSINRIDISVGLRYDGVPLQSIHTHWHDMASVTGFFNKWVDTFTQRFAGAHKPLKQWRRQVGME